MKYHKIEVDEEVYKYLLGKVRDFDDTPNAILRRELLNGEKEAKSPNRKLRLPDFASGIPVALQHTLEVIFLVKKNGFSRIEATKAVARRHKVKRETVLDKYGRQLNQSTSEVDRLLEDQNLHKFEHILKQKFSKNTQVIEDFFNDLKPSIARDKVEKTANFVNSKSHVSLKTLHNRGYDLVKTKPISVIINKQEYSINSWTEFDKVVVDWTIENGFLDQSTLPIYATDNKYFLNSKPEHFKQSYKGEWKKIDEGIFLDSKYNAPSHIRNVLNLIDQLSIDKKCRISLLIK